MKINLIIKRIFNKLGKNAKTFLIIPALFSYLNFNAINSKLDKEVETKLRNFIIQFFDKNVEPNKPFEAWLKDLRELLKETPDYKLYCAAISDIERARNVVDAGKNFEKFRNLIPENLKKFFQERYSKAIVLKNLTERLKKRAK